MKTQEEKNEYQRKWYYTNRNKILAKAKNKVILFRLANPKNNQKGENNGSWKGGVVYDNGYRFIWVGPSHPRNRNGYVQEHVLIMEKHLGRYLKYYGRGNAENEVVHHIDKNRLNNNISNLQLMTLREHSILHHKLNKEITNGKKIQ